MNAANGTKGACSRAMLKRVLVVSTMIVGCGSSERAPAPSGEHPAGMTAPTPIGMQSTGAVKFGTVREIPSLMRWPTLGGAAPSDVNVSFEGASLPFRDGRFEPGARTGWFGVTRAGVRVLAQVEPIDGELTLPIVSAAATGVPRADRAAVVFQLTDNLGSPIVGVTAESKPGVIGPCYDNGTDVVQDVPVTTNNRGGVAYLEIPVTKPTFEVELMVFGRPMIAKVPIAEGTVTFLRTSVQ